MGFTQSLHIDWAQICRHFVVAENEEDQHKMHLQGIVRDSAIQKPEYNILSKDGLSSGLTEYFVLSQFVSV